MISRSLKQKTSIAAALLSAAMTVSFSTAACAQDRGFPGPPPGRGPGGFGGPGGPGGFGRGPRPATIAGTPITALADGLKLTPTQKTKIAALQSQFRQQRERLLPRPVRTEDGPTQADFTAMRANGQKVRAGEQAVSAKIIALLTPAQKKLLPGLLRESDQMRGVGLPPELVQRLKLTAAQKKTVAEYVKAHPRRERGFGGPPPPPM